MKKVFEYIILSKRQKMMNCTTIMPDDNYGVEKEKDRRTSRGITACLRGETDDYYDYEADGKFF